jgi:hypothetical protein
MAYTSGTPTWDDFYTEGLGPSIPLSEEAREQGPSGVLPSGEANSFDFRQQGSAINSPFPYPNLETPEDLAFSDGVTRSDFPDAFSDEWWAASGIFKTYGPENDTLVSEKDESGIFHFNKLISQFSNAVEVSTKQIDDFTIFNPYIHHERMPVGSRDAGAIKIPYVSTSDVSIDFNAYGGQGGFGG